MKYLITGAAGFIGSHISEMLLKDTKNKVFGLDNLNDYYAPKIKVQNLKVLKSNSAFKFIKTDLEDLKQTSKTLVDINPDIVIHCAARAGVRSSIHQPLLYTHTNILGTQNLLHSLKDLSSNVKVILLSSSSVYGEQKEAPFVETMIPSPTSPYGATKRAMEILAEQYFLHYGLQIAVVRPFSIYGPRGRVDMAPFLIIQAAEKNKTFFQFGTNENNKRDWTYIEDFAEGVIQLSQLDKYDSYEVYNLGNSQPIGIEDFITTSQKMLKKHLGTNLSVKKTDRGKEELPLTYANIEKAKKTFGYNPKISYEEGLEKLYKYYVENKKLYNFDNEN